MNGYLKFLVGMIIVIPILSLLVFIGRLMLQGEIPAWQFWGCFITSPLLAYGMELVIRSGDYEE